MRCSMMTDNFLNTQERRTEKSMTHTIRVLFRNEGEDGKGREMVTLSTYIHTYICRILVLVWIPPPFN